MKLKEFIAKLPEFLQEGDGSFSATRLFALIVCFNASFEWIYSVLKNGTWNPSWTEVGLIAGVLGFKVIQRIGEEK